MEGLNTAYLSLGSNIGDRYHYLFQACQQLNNFAFIEVISPIYETPPLGFDADSNFLNLVLQLSTQLSAHDLLHEISQIENDLGRVRGPSGKYVSRVIDIDIIFYNRVIVENEHLMIPHPRFADRKFVLKPLFDIIPDFIDPISGSSIRELLKRSSDKSLIIQSEMSIKTEELI